MAAQALKKASEDSDAVCLLALVTEPAEWLLAVGSMSLASNHQHVIHGARRLKIDPCLGCPLEGEDLGELISWEAGSAASATICFDPV